MASTTPPHTGQNPHLAADPTSRPFIAPQPGPQERFLSLRWVDIIIYGGAAGGGKSWALLLDAAYHAVFQPVKGFGAVIFRRTSPQITQTGGLWETSQGVYPLTSPAGKPRQTPWLGWQWPQYGTSVRFAHLQYEVDKFSWQGGQLPYIGFDELPHFTEGQFFYLLSRNRSPIPGIKPIVRATTNPEPDSWVKRFLAPWVDATYPDPAASGEVRWFYRDGDTILWLRTPEHRPAHIGRDEVHSVTFIEARLEDNPALMRADPGYRGRIQALPLVERTILAGGPGAWDVRLDGNMFKRSWFRLVDSAPTCVEVVRRWDLAGSQPHKGYSDPDWTCGVKMGRTATGVYCVLDVVFARDTPNGVKRLIQQTARLDGADVAIRLPQDPGQAGKAQLYDFVTFLDGYDVRGVPETGDKATRAKPLSAQAEVGNVAIVRGSWNDQYINQMTAFPNPRVHDDAVDASSGAYTYLAQGSRTIPVASTRLHLSAQQRATADRATQAEHLARLKAAREALAETGAAHNGQDDAAIGDLEAAIAAADEARRVVSVRADGSTPVYETDSERATRLLNEQQIATNLRYLETEFGLTPGEGFGGNDW